MAGVKRAGIDRMRKSEVRKKMLSPESGGGTREPRSQEGENGRGCAKRAFWKAKKAGGAGTTPNCTASPLSPNCPGSRKRVPLSLFAGALLARGVAGKRS